MKTEYENLTALQQVVFWPVKDAFLNNDYEIQLDGDEYGSDGYVSGYLIIAGYSVRCSINKAMYICWHDEKFLINILDSVPHLTRKVCAQVKRTMEQKVYDRIEKRVEKKWQRRIAELEAELKQLKGE